MTRFALAHVSTAVAVVALALSPLAADAQSRVQYGRITNVTPTTVNNSTHQNVGTVVGGSDVGAMDSIGTPDDTLPTY